MNRPALRLTTIVKITRQNRSRCTYHTTTTVQVIKSFDHDIIHKAFDMFAECLSFIEVYESNVRYPSNLLNFGLVIGAHEINGRTIWELERKLCLIRKRAERIGYVNFLE